MTLRLDHTYAALPAVLYSQQAPAQFPKPECLILNASLADGLGLHFDQNTLVETLLGYSVDSSQPIAQAYAGHQYGHFTMLGDGRALLLGEHIGEHTGGQETRWDIQLKGAGRTPYSRGGDGKAALGPMLREYLISEAMHALGIPTTRSLAVIKTGERVYRQQALEGAVLVRVAASHIRVGTFQFAAMQDAPDILSALVDYTLERHYPEFQNSENKALALLEAVVERQARLIVEWMRVGFIHGVMNTDNMTLSGETIDYGPCAFMDEFNWKTVFSSIDHHGRYAYGNQPSIAGWNLARLAESLLPVIAENQDKAVELATAVVQNFSDLYQRYWLNMMRNKLGWQGELEGDQSLIDDLFSLMRIYKLDYTQTFFELTYHQRLTSNLENSEAFLFWLKAWKSRQYYEGDTSVSEALMKAANPVIVPRNHLVEKALTLAEEGDLNYFNKFLTVLKTPYTLDKSTYPFQSLPSKHERIHATYCGT